MAQLITSGTTLLGVIVSSVISLRNSKKLDVVHRTTDGLATRNEVIARKLGIAEGLEKGRQENGR